MKIELDRAKHERNRRERGIGFDYASLIFENETLEWQDTRADYGEDRFIAVGAIEQDVLVVVYTIRAEARRIISARAANKKERKLWQALSAKP
jgi:uncharacterized DUF497 family protein